MANVEKISVEVAYALPERQVIISLSVKQGATLEQAILSSGIMDQFPEIDLGRNKVGIFGKPGKLADILRAGDRVEIYRALTVDPKEARRRRAERKAAKTKGGDKG